MIGVLLAVIAGLCASLASVFAKLAMASDSTTTLCVQLTEYSRDILPPLEENLTSTFLDCDQVVLYMRIICFGMIFLCNALMWTIYVKALQKCSSTVEATLINTASNLTFTAAFGFVLFGESLSLLWWIGMSFIVVGMCLIINGNEISDEPGKKDS